MAKGSNRCGVRARRRVLVLAMVLPLGACTFSRPGASASVDAAAVPRGALVTVSNAHVQDVRVYLVRDGLRYPLGTLGTGERRSFAVPTSVLGHGGRLRLQADLVGDRRRFTSEWIEATRGDHVEWFVQPRLQLSHFRVRPLAGSGSGR